MADTNEIKVVHAPLPPTAVQALYHAATGKTENLSKLLSKSYIIRQNDLDQLYYKIKQQMDHYIVVAGPTVTVNITFENHEHHQYSSWDRFKIFDVGKTDIVKNIVIKFEFIIKMPEISQAPAVSTTHRYVIDIDIDSRLSSKEENWLRERNAQMQLDDFPAFSISIDFVDYIVAKNFLRTVEEWFSNLESVSNPKWLVSLGRYLFRRPVFFIQVGYVGSALFIAVYTFLRRNTPSSAVDYSYMTSLSLFFFALTSFIGRELSDYYTKSISLSVVPATITLTKGDERAFSAVSLRSNSIVSTVSKFIFGMILALAINVLASFIYAWMIT